ncbi:uracil-DNA glycosylase family protein [Sphingomonas naphthae]|uniref:Uracil-DNA glycosylase family protein n=1 Tax=Sphingomonas naphthae TaxID=1813468 RepID=A0ABY7TNJ0_9SPHN|nr:uracil-DNA glycosylase family protein [Sphingomonas naphthae]WCT74808.1 uracil-DNA glycosylase family protein [Sphingomonas naphthae]
MYSKSVLHSALHWWELAGVDTLVEEDVRDWFAPVRPREPVPAAEAAPAAPAPAALPTDLAAFHEWWTSDTSLPGAPAQRVAPSGDAASGLMLLIDMPDSADAAAGALFSGEAGLLFDRMLAAIGRDRQSAYLASIWPARPAGGIADKAHAARLAEIALHHIALAAPRRLLLLGKGPVEALTGLDVVQARGRLHDIGGVPAVATHLPTPAWRAAAKAAAWADLLLLTEDFA